MATASTPRTQTAQQEQQSPDPHIFKGLQQDIGSVYQPAEALRDALNIRLTPRDNLILSQSHSGVIITNERGTEDTGIELEGTYLGHAVLNDYAVIFTHSQATGIDYIYRLYFGENNEELPVKLLYYGDLGFDLNYPIETITDYETSYIQKVYWTDGINQPRVINIMSDNIGKQGNNSFDLIQELPLNEDITVEKLTGTAGEFEPGVIQYAFTYYNEYLQESNIFYTTPLYYVSPADRGAKADEMVSNAFKIQIKNFSKDFDYLRIYSIQRTALNVAPIVRIVENVDLRLKIEPENPPDKNWWSDKVKESSIDGWGKIWTIPSDVEWEIVNEGDQKITDKEIYKSNKLFPKASYFVYAPKPDTQTKHGYACYDGNDDSLQKIPAEKCYLIQGNGAAYIRLINSDKTKNKGISYIPIPTKAYRYLFLWEGDDGWKIVCANCIPVIFTVSHNNANQRRDDWTQAQTGEGGGIPGGSTVNTGKDEDDNDSGGNTNIGTTDDGPELGYYAFVSYEDLTFQYATSSQIRQDDDRYNVIQVIDIGTTGAAIDAAEMTFAGGVKITAGTLCQKDGTLFFGNIAETATSVVDAGGNSVVGWSNTNMFNYPSSIKSSYREVQLNHAMSGDYDYWNSLMTSYSGGFKSREYYRLGIQFQYKTGKWSMPIWIGDAQQSNNPELQDGILKVPVFEYEIPDAAWKVLKDNNSDYIRVRPLVVFPGVNDRNIIAQGIVCPTLFTPKRREQDKDVYAQSSWFIRPFTNAEHESLYYSHNNVTFAGPLASTSTPEQPYYYSGQFIYSDKEDSRSFKPSQTFRNIEIQGAYTNRTAFYKDEKTITFHTPDFVFLEDSWYLDVSQSLLDIVGYVIYASYMQDVDIVLKSAPIGEAAGFTHESFVKNSDKPERAGLYFEDYIVNDDKKSSADKQFQYFPWSTTADNSSDKMYSPVRWVVYPWHRQGSLNNDSARMNNPDLGTRSAEIDTKRMSTLFYGNSNFKQYQYTGTPNKILDAQVFHSDGLSILKLKENNEGRIYYGNIDTAMHSDYEDFNFFAFNHGGENDGLQNRTASTSFNEVINGLMYKSGTAAGGDTTEQKTELYFKGKKDTAVGKLGQFDAGLFSHRPIVRMKYRSTPHIAIQMENKLIYNAASDVSTLYEYPIVELVRYDQEAGEADRAAKMFGGTSDTVLKSHMWIPAGPPVRLDAIKDSHTITFEWGDTWYQRYDCMKTYSYSLQDTNQVVEIASFMVESKVNLDGRCDRNRGQVNNTMMTPSNFNLMNMVYSQYDNFFSYSILEDRFTNYTDYTNQITWTNKKNPAAEVDAWTRINLAATYVMDGSKGEVTAIRSLANDLYCFQSHALSHLDFNSRVQIPNSEGVPIEITNNYKMDGATYVSEKIGCDNKASIQVSSNGIYFIDSISKQLQLFNGKECASVSSALNMSRWFTQRSSERWTPNTKDSALKLCQDVYNQDIYILNGSKNTLGYSEILSAFTSFYSYGPAYDMFNVNNKFYSITKAVYKETYEEESADEYKEIVIDHDTTKIHQMFSGNYNRFYEQLYPFYIWFVSNLEPTESKTFNNIEMRGHLWNLDGDKTLPEAMSTKALFDTVRVWHEYQDTGYVSLETQTVGLSNMKNKQGIWRINVPRDQDNPLTRISSLWTNVYLGTTEESNLDKNGKLELYDVNVLYKTGS